MRDKTKANLSGQLKPDTLTKLKQISADKKLSQIKTVEWLIDNYNEQTQIEPAKQTPIPVTKKTPPKTTDKEPSMAELLKQHIMQK